MYMFHVPKGDADIKMVYNGTKSELNDSLFAPWFMLPTSDVMCRWTIAGSWLVDNNYGDQFLNFPLYPDLQKFCGINLSQLYPEMSRNEAQIYVRVWLQNAMGLKPSPYVSIQGETCAKRITLSNCKDESNPFQWEKVMENLPFSQ